MSNRFDPAVGAVILAAGKGTRLNCTDMPKVMLTIAGKPMVAHTIETLEMIGLSARQICVVVGFCKEKVMEYFGTRVSYAVQEEQRGTGHAAYVGARALPASVDTVLVLGGDDGMFYRKETLSAFIEEHRASGAVLSLLSAVVERPAQFGRIIRHPDGRVEIIEKEYLTEEQQRIHEISTGTFCLNRQWFESIYPAMPPLRKLGEYGLPTALAMARNAGLPYRVFPLADSREWFGGNTPEELSEAKKLKFDL
jgi:bifunctional UDP-N-acetylglucosamine pyrophosphorylase/glucosamine-1-phosphate N-acetyltransferase